MKRRRKNVQSNYDGSLYGSTHLPKMLYAMTWKIDYDRLSPVIVKSRLNEGDIMSNLMHVSCLFCPALVINGWPVAYIEGAENPSIHPLLNGRELVPYPGIPEEYKVCMEVVAKAYGLTVSDGTAEYPVLSDRPDTWLMSRIEGTRQTGMQPQAKELVESICEIVYRTEYGCNANRQIKQRVATVEWANRMYFYLMRYMKKEGYAGILGTFVEWMNEFALHVTAEEAVGVTSYWRGAKPYENKAPSVSRYDAWPLPYQARLDLYMRLVPQGGKPFPPPATEVAWHEAHERQTTEKRRAEARERYARSRKAARKAKPAAYGDTLDDILEGMTVTRPRNKGLIALKNGQRILTCWPSPYREQLVDMLMPVIQQFIDEKKEELVKML